MSKDMLLPISSLEELDAINYESLRGGHTVFFGKFYTNFGIAAAANAGEAVINDSHEEMPVSNYRPEYGTYLGYPAIVGRKGILERLDLHLTEEEERKLLHSAETIKRKYTKRIRACIKSKESGTEIGNSLEFVRRPLHTD